MNTSKPRGNADASYGPILEPNLYGSFGHVDILGDSLPDSSSGGGVLVELLF